MLKEIKNELPQTAECTDDCLDDCARVLLQPLIMSRRTSFVLNRAAFLFVKDALDLWNIGYFLLLVAKRFRKC